MTAEAFARSVRGARHRRLGEKREDAADWSPTAWPVGVTAAVADGHGDRRCPRSRDGARFAVASALEAAQGWVAESVGEPDRADLVARLVARWRAAVDEDLSRRPVSAAEAGDGGATHARLLYGTTIVLAVVNGTGVTVLRIGDGDLVGVSSEGVAHRLLEPDAAAVPGETRSLSADDAELWARTRTLAAAEAPSLIVLVTDGVADAYPHDDGLLGACRELHEVWRDGGREQAEGSVLEWLQAAAEHSGDDASAAAVRFSPRP